MSSLVQCIAYIMLPIALAYSSCAIALPMFSPSFMLQSKCVFASFILRCSIFEELSQHNEIDTMQNPHYVI